MHAASVSSPSAGLHVLDVNPAHAVRSPKYVVKTGKTPVLTAQEARELLDNIDLVKKKRLAGTISEVPELPVCAIARPHRRDGLHLCRVEPCSR